MGLFDKKFCDICGDKVNLLTQKKLSDGQLCRQIKQDGASVNQGYSQMNQSYGQPQQHPLRFKTTPIIMLHPLHRKQLTLPGFAHPAAHVTKANSAKAAAVQSLQQCLHAARAADGLRQTVSLCRNSSPNVVITYRSFRLRSKEKIHCGRCECNQFFLFVNELHGFLCLFSQKRK